MRLHRASAASLLCVSCLSVSCLAGGVTVKDADQLRNVLAATSSYTAITLLPGTYTLSASTLDYRDKNFVDLWSAGATITREPNLAAWKDKVMIDMTGSTYCTWTGITVDGLNPAAGTADDPNAPAAALFLGRVTGSPGPPSSGNHVFDHCTFTGRFRTACVVNVASEVDDFYSCRFDNYAHSIDDPNYCYSFVISSGYTNSNILRNFTITTLNGSIVEDSMRSVNFYACEFTRTCESQSNHVMDPDDAVVLMDDGADAASAAPIIGNLLFDGCRFNVGPDSVSGITNANTMKAIFLWTDGGGDSLGNNQVVVRDCFGQGGPKSIFWGVKAPPPNSGHLRGLTMRSNVWQTAERHIVTDPNMDLLDADIAEISIKPDFAGYDWGYLSDGTATTSGNSNCRRVLCDVSSSDHGRFDYGNTGIYIQTDPDTVGTIPPRTDTDSGYGGLHTPWSALRFRNTTAGDEVTTLNGTDALSLSPTGSNDGVLPAQYVRKRGQLGGMILQGSGSVSGSGYLTSPLGNVVYTSAQGIVPPASGSVVGVAIQANRVAGTLITATVEVRQGGTVLAPSATAATSPPISSGFANGSNQIQPGKCRFVAGTPMQLFVTVTGTGMTLAVNQVQATAILAFD